MPFRLPLQGLNGQPIPLKAAIKIVKIGVEDYHVEAQWRIAGALARVPCFRAYSLASAEAVAADYAERQHVTNTLLDLRAAFKGGWLGGADYDLGMRAIKDALALECRNMPRIRELIGRAQYHLPYAIARTKAGRYQRQLAMAEG